MKRMIFDADHELFRDSARRFFETEIGPHAERWREQGYVDREAFRRSGEHGYLLMWADEKYGGSGIRDFRYEQVMIEENLRYGDIGFFNTLHSRLVGPYLGELGVNMTVSRLNFTEVRAFLDLALELAQRRGDRRTFVEFKRVRRWGAHDSDAAWAALDLDQLAPDELEVLRAQLREVEELRPSLAGSLEVRSNLGDLVAAPR